MRRLDDWRYDLLDRLWTRLYDWLMGRPTSRYYSGPQGVRIWHVREERD
jgi:hypothetical protein